MAPSIISRLKDLLTFSKREPVLSYPLSEDMTRNYYMVRLKVIQTMNQEEFLCVMYLPFGESTVQDLINLSSNLTDTRRKKDYPYLIESVTYDVPTSLSNDSIVTIMVHWNPIKSNSLGGI